MLGQGQHMQAEAFRQATALQPNSRVCARKQQATGEAPAHPQVQAAIPKHTPLKGLTKTLPNVKHIEITSEIITVKHTKMLNVTGTNTFLKSDVLGGIQGPALRLSKNQTCCKPMMIPRSTQQNYLGNLEPSKTISVFGWRGGVREHRMQKWRKEMAA